jgi:hypothetical protein
MTHTNVDVHIANWERLSANREAATREADAQLSRSASEVLRERTYGDVRVLADWSRRPAKLAIEVIDERAQQDVRDVPSYVELFVHDAFLILNIAVPGSFSGTFNGLRLDARVFENGWNASPGTIEPLQLADVAKWYDSLQTGTRQIAETNVERALFHLLHLARGEEDDTLSMLLLSLAAEALEVEVDARLKSAMPVLHPMHDDALDPRIDDFDVTEIIDRASAAVIAGLQSRVRQASRI